MSFFTLRSGIRMLLAFALAVGVVGFDAPTPVKAEAQEAPITLVFERVVSWEQDASRASSTLNVTVPAGTYDRKAVVTDYNHPEDPEAGPVQTQESVNVPALGIGDTPDLPDELTTMTLELGEFEVTEALTSVNLNHSKPQPWDGMYNSVQVTVILTPVAEPDPVPDPEFDQTVKGSCPDGVARLSGAVFGTVDGYGLVDAILVDQSSVSVAEGALGPQLPLEYGVLWPGPDGEAITVKTGIDHSDGQAFAFDNVEVEWPCDEEEPFFDFTHTVNESLCLTYDLDGGTWESEIEVGNHPSSTAPMNVDMLAKGPLAPGESDTFTVAGAGLTSVKTGFEVSWVGDNVAQAVSVDLTIDPPQDGCYSQPEPEADPWAALDDVPCDITEVELVLGNNGDADTELRTEISEVGSDVPPALALYTVEAKSSFGIPLDLPSDGTILLINVYDQDGNKIFTTTVGFEACPVDEDPPIPTSVPTGAGMSTTPGAAMALVGLVLALGAVIASVKDSFIEGIGYIRMLWGTSWSQ